MTMKDNVLHTDKISLPWIAFKNRFAVRIEWQIPMTNEL